MHADRANHPALLCVPLSLFPETFHKPCLLFFTIVSMRRTPRGMA